MVYRQRAGRERLMIDGAGHSAGDAGMPEAITAALDGLAAG